MNAAELYDWDFYEWTVRNAKLLRAGRASEADLKHIAEEIADMGKRERRRIALAVGGSDRALAEVAGSAGAEVAELDVDHQSTTP
jgi:hypothetical protein